jgi:transposase-like protein
MVKTDQEQAFIGRYSAKGNYDKRFIARVVEEVHNGMPRQQVCQEYGISIGTLKKWLAAHKLGIPSSRVKKTVSIQVKRSVVRAVKSGRLSIKEAQHAYGIQAAQTIRNWIRQLNQENDELSIVNDSLMKKNKPAKNTTDSNQDIEALQKALQEAHLKIAALNTLIDVAEEQLKINIRKKPGAKQSND